MSTDTPPPPAGRQWPPTEVPRDDAPAPHRSGAQDLPPAPVVDSGPGDDARSSRRYLLLLSGVAAIAVSLAVILVSVLTRQ